MRMRIWVFGIAVSGFDLFFPQTVLAPSLSVVLSIALYTCSPI